MSEPYDEQTQIDLAMAAGDTYKEMAFRSSRVGRLLPSGLFLERGTGRVLVEDLSILREFSLKTGNIEKYAHDTMHLAFVTYHYDRGNIVRNQEAAIELILEVLTIYTEVSHPSEWAQAVTSAGKYYNEREFGDEAENLRAAESYLRSALRVRSPETNAVDWSFTVGNLAETLNRSTPYTAYEDVLPRLLESAQFSREAAEVLISDGQVELGTQSDINGCLALWRYVSVLRRRRLSDFIQAERYDQEVLGVDSSETESEEIGYDPISLVLNLANLSESNPAAFEGGRNPEWAVRLRTAARPTPDERAMLDDAVEIAAAAHAREGSGVSRSRASQLMADITAMYGESTESATKLYQRALDEVGETYIPRFTAQVADRAGQGWSMLGQWENAANAYVRALTAIDEVYEYGIDETERELELVQYPKIIEMAAYALAKMGDLKRAVQVLERGRARNLTRRLILTEPNMERLSSVDAALAELINAELPGARAGSPNSISALETLHRRVRKETCLENFGRTINNSELAASSLTGCPLVYLLTTPAGSLALAVSPDCEELEVQLLADCEVTSAALVTHLVRYNTEGRQLQLHGIQSRDLSTLEATMNNFSDAISDLCGTPVAEHVRAVGTETVAIVAAGLLGTAPISAARVEIDGRATRLIDHTAVTLAPSAAALSALRRRRQRRDGEQGRFVGLCDGQRQIPELRLRWAEPEVRRSAEFYPDTFVAAGEAATLANIRAESANAAVLHLACHGLANEANPWHSFVALADEVWPAYDIWNGTNFQGCPLIVLSACESGRYGTAFAESNEYVGLVGSFLAAGATDVLCSLAQVNDYATSLIVAKFHEFMQVHSPESWNPAQALRAAQNWFRTATLEQLAELAQNEADQTPGGGHSEVRYFFARNKRANTEAKPQLLSHWAQLVAIG